MAMLIQLCKLTSRIFPDGSLAERLQFIAERIRLLAGQLKGD
jgi:hypothetical protein